MTVLQKANLIAEIKKYSEEREKFQINVIELTGAIKILQKQLQELIAEENKEKADKPNNVIPNSSVSSDKPASVDKP